MSEERMVECNEFTWPDPFWLQPVWRWEAMMAAGVRDAFVASQLAALANDTKAMRHPGKVLAAAQLGKDYGFKDINGKSPTPLTVADV